MEGLIKRFCFVKLYILSCKILLDTRPTEMTLSDRPTMATLYD